MRLIIISWLWISCQCIGQTNTIQEINEVTITFSLDTIEFQNEWEGINSSKIESIQADDASELLQKLTSTSIKSYGGLGGLKTISARGLGANHSNIVIDGFGINNTQNGQINLGQIHTDNIIYLRNNTDGSYQFLQPISAQVAGGQFSLETFENNFGSGGLKYRLVGKQGSFNQLGTYSTVKYSNKKILISGHGSCRKADGKYPYTLTNGNQSTEAFRSNNDYSDYSFGMTGGMKHKRSVLRLGYVQKEFNQGLPGAVILYNNTADERMTNKDQNLFGDHVFKGKKYTFRSYFKLNSNQLTYTDPDNLGQDGGVEITYKNRSLQFGLAGSSQLTENLKLHFGAEQILSDLNVSDSNFARPLRMHNFGILGLNYSFLDKFKIRLQISEQYISEYNSVGISAGNKFKINPYFEISFNPRKHLMNQKLWYRSSFRMPSFNELYYNNIGNLNLEPEEAHQINYGWSLSTSPKGMLQWYFRNNVYLNYVTNKIIAIPTKNLFTWSMQNVENARILGADFKLGSKWGINEHVKFDLDLNYSFQRAVDVSDPNSPTYKDQIAYIPIHTGNIDFSIKYRTFGMRLSNYTNSLRYSLNENISANQVEGFWVSTLSTFYTLKLKNKNNLNFRFTVKNLFNSQYAVIRSFVMPGRNYLIVLKYAFN